MKRHTSLSQKQRLAVIRTSLRTPAITAVVKIHFETRLREIDWDKCRRTYTKLSCEQLE